MLLSPNFGVADWRADMLTWSRGSQIARLVQGEYRSWQPTNERHARYWTTRYPTKAAVTVMSLVNLVGELDVSPIRVPVLVM